MDSFINFLVALTPEKLQTYETALLHLLEVLSVATFIAGHTAALIGSPKAGDDANAAHKLIVAAINVLATNYGKSKNTPEKL